MWNINAAGNDGPFMEKRLDRRLSPEQRPGWDDQAFLIPTTSSFAFLLLPSPCNWLEVAKPAAKYLNFHVSSIIVFGVHANPLSFTLAANSQRRAESSQAVFITGELILRDFHLHFGTAADCKWIIWIFRAPLGFILHFIASTHCWVSSENNKWWSADTVSESFENAA